MASAFILVVDDELELSDVLQEILESRGYRARTATTTEQALQALEDAPQLVLLDWYLPDGPPEELAKLCHERGIPVVLTTAATESARLARLVGAVAVLEKPFDIATFVQVIERALGQPASPQPQSHS